jgi:hypothetical protein
MFFNFKKSKITVDCFTYSPAAYELYKIRSAKVYYPEHIKKLNSGINIQEPNTNIVYSRPTIKRCVGLNDLYKKGFIIPFWMDFICQPKEHAENKSALGTTDTWHQSNIVHHFPVQYPGVFTNYFHVKFRGPWHIKEKIGVDFLWNATTWNINNDVEKYIIPPAIINFTNNCETNLNIFFCKDLEPFTLSAGTPLIHIIPLSEKDVEVKCHLVSHQEWISKSPYPDDMPTVQDGTRLNRLRKDRQNAKELDQLENKGKCPFGFTK